ncbi:hypothetical protein, variant [Puccinia striiformis f. sp. tritici PST-78]|uniref:Uncharacterized protein n=1 Tax=Puccinia striiformis f. sp. tritici PST-78 TaxID=1165861 RepID=A0A0L0VEQ4_9BASI|nr:hypothetical protein PSTG_09011 [Puccinia striiformis f. sp. tritici PST-78]KNE97792.1 hypothetical protein, variant [Puccinia striiformis f. sp. tritici PST-78]
MISRNSFPVLAAILVIATISSVAGQTFSCGQGYHPCANGGPACCPNNCRSPNC